MRNGDSSTPPIIGRILDAYGLVYDQVLPPQGGYRNKAYPITLNGAYVANLILYKSEPGILDKIHHANLVSNYLAAQGFLTRQTLSPKIVTLKSVTKTKYGALYNYLPGHTIPWEGYTQKHIKLLGLALGRIHTSLTKLERPAGHPAVTDEYLLITERMLAYFSQPAVQHAISSKLGITLNTAAIKRYQKLLRLCADLPNQQPLHMDFVRSNILFGQHSDALQIEDVAITGILDFEKTAYGHPVFDVARTLAFLLVDCKFKTGSKMRKYFIHSGYIKRGHCQIDTDLLEPLLNLFLTYDFYKFLRHNPYEYLPQNEHFIRTRDILIKRGLLTLTQDRAKIAAGVAEPVL